MKLSIPEDFFLSFLPNLQSKVAVVTGGAAGIGLETTVYLAQKGCTVYVASRNREKSLKGIAAAKARLGENAGPIHFHQLDLATIENSWESATELSKQLDRLDIVIANAGTWRFGFSKDGYENTFQTNHLGHFAFILPLLALLEKTAKVQGEASIVITTSQAYKNASKPDYSALKGRDAPPTLSDKIFGFRKYFNSKLHNVYFAAELDARLQERGITNIYVNSCHPGTAGSTDLGSEAFGDNALARAIRDTIKFLARTFANTVEDSAKTQVWLAASEKLMRNNNHGQYFEPFWNWANYYRGSKQVEMTPLAANDEERKRSWDFSVDAIRKAGFTLDGWI